jgi:hypothetical protein
VIFRGRVASTFSPDLVDGLDEPVRRYFLHAIPEGAPLPASIRFTMAGRIRIGPLWLPFTAQQELGREGFEWRARVGPVLRVRDRYGDGAGLTEGRLFGRRTLFRADDEETTRSAAGRAALEACAFAPATVLPQHGVSWRAESDEHVVGQRELPPERPEVRIRIDGDGAVRAVTAARWNSTEHGYVPCGADLDAERRLGAFTIPSRMTVSWWYGTERATPFFRARIGP